MEWEDFLTQNQIFVTSVTMTIKWVHPKNGLQVVHYWRKMDYMESNTMTFHHKNYNSNRTILNFWTDPRWLSGRMLFLSGPR
jgi:hypothetical protein